MHSQTVKMKKVVGTVSTGRAGISYYLHFWLSKGTTKDIKNSYRNETKIVVTSRNRKTSNEGNFHNDTNR